MELEIITTERGGQKICFGGFLYTKKHVAKSVDKITWRCVKRASLNCTAILKTTKSHTEPEVVSDHNHLTQLVVKLSGQGKP